MTIEDLWLFILNENLSSIFPDVLATIVFITMPITSVSVKRSFSKLKLIKNYLHSSVSLALQDGYIKHWKAPNCWNRYGQNDKYLCKYKQWIFYVKTKYFVWFCNILFYKNE